MDFILNRIPRKHLQIGFNLVNIFFVSPLLIYVGVQRASSPEWLYQGLIGLAALIFGYHLFMVYNKWLSNSSSLWVNLIYVLFVAPVLFVIGYYKKETSRLFFEATLLLAFATLGYNIYNLVLQLNTVTGDSN
jgi:hypothetical protein